MYKMLPQRVPAVHAVRMIRLRFPELLDEQGLTPYHLSRRSEGRIPLSTAYRLQQHRGVAKAFSTRLLDTLCEVLKVGPGDLLEYTQETAKRPASKSGKAAAKSAAKRGGK